ncbi:MAG: hypothetical protein WKG07_02200 [Hymenobacter sp.]
MKAEVGGTACWPARPPAWSQRARATKAPGKTTRPLPQWRWAATVYERKIPSTWPSRRAVDLTQRKSFGVRGQPRCYITLPSASGGRASCKIRSLPL